MRRSPRFGGAWSVIIVFQVVFSVVCLPFGIAAASEAYHKSGLRAAYPADRFLTFLPTLDVDVDAGAGDSAPDGERSAPSTIGAAAGAPDGHAADAAADDRHAILAELAERLGQEPEAAAIALASHLPGSYHPLRRIEAQRGGEPPFAVDANTEGNLVRVGAVSPGFFDTFEIPLLAGRDFSQADVSGAHGVVVINEALARNIGGNAIGTRVRVAASGDDEPGPWLEVIGVTRNFGLTPTGAGEADYMYTPASPDDARYMVLRVNGGASAFAPRLRTLALQVDPMLRLQDVLSLRDVIRREDQPMIHATLTGLGVVLLAVLLSAASLYALMSVAVALRTREVGIRLAIGASSRAVLMSLFRRAATQVGVGILAGNIVVALLLFVVVEEVRAAFVLPPMLGASVVMLLVGGAACLVPARRALRIQPTAALKETR